VARVYSQSLAGAASFTGNSPVTTIPDDEVWVIRDVEVTVGANVGPPQGAWWFEIDSARMYLPELPGSLISTGGTYSWDGRIVLLPGTTLQFVANDITVDFWVSGYVLGP
jgi:hypothetical protein